MRISPRISLQLTPFADLTPYLKKHDLVALNIGPDQQLYAVLTSSASENQTRTHTVFATTFEACFPEVRAYPPKTYRVLAFYEGVLTLDFSIANEAFNIHRVQPLPNDEILLVCCRSTYLSETEFDRNGRIYTSSGEFVREILLGDGIEDVQATSDGTIWTSYFDEGVLGNYGWNHPVGSAGLLAWDSLGNKVYEFSPPNGLDRIIDCKALNVESDASAWFYYYVDFPLVHLHNWQIEAFWSMPVKGSRAFAVCRDHALFGGGYDNREEFLLLQLRRSEEVRQLAAFTLIDEDGETLSANGAFARNDAIYRFSDGRVYRCTVDMAADAI